MPKQDYLPTARPPRPAPANLTQPQCSPGPAEYTIRQSSQRGRASTQHSTAQHKAAQRSATRLGPASRRAEAARTGCSEVVRSMYYCTYIRVAAFSLLMDGCETKPNGAGSWYL